jgi:secondary thiamine-phosphate synthase enzyme
MIYKKTIDIKTSGRGTIELTSDITDLVRQSGINVGLCHLFVHHTSASLMISENADPSVRRDLEGFMSRMAPDGHPDYEHDAEGPDDMPAHIRSVLTGSELTLPVSGGRPTLGTWQGVYLWEHRQRPHRRSITVTVMGEA